jgi:DNA-binding transcriptional MerR regulator
MTDGSDHQSIGEVLAALRDEFPDVTISKIRFLESQGLIDPERTPSGYRKFREHDVARLRWVLHQQKDNFLPLKVIKSRLDEVGPGELPDESSTAPEAAATSPASPPAKKAKRARKSTKRTEPAKTTKRAAATRSAKAAPAEPAFEPQMLPLDDATPEDLHHAASGVSLTRKELAKAAGITDAGLAELEEFGLVAPVAGQGDRSVFSEDALVVARLAAAFAAHGIGARHLRMFRVSADREAGLYDQVIAPRLRRRNPEARAQAREDLMALAGLGRALRSAFLRESASGLLRD